MARRRQAPSTGESHEDIIRWYRDELRAPARTPWPKNSPPIVIGPTWTTKRGRWVLPDATLGWDVLGYCGSWHQHGTGEPWRFTLEQARWILWWYSLDELGRFVYHDGVLQRLKGWGKDPVGANLLSAEAFGPCRFAGWGRNDQPEAMDVPDAWVQTAAVALQQTKNTMRLFPSLFTKSAIRHFRIQVGKELIHGLGDRRLIEAVTSSPTVLEGARSTFILKNETQHWWESNRGHDMADVVERNAAKSEDGGARALAITNAYDPAKDSSAQHDREAWELAEAGGSHTTGILYDSLEARPSEELSPKRAPKVIVQIRGDSTWLSADRIVKSILDTRNPPSRSRRWWYNQITAAEDAWIDVADLDICIAVGQREGIAPLKKSDEVGLFFDGSKSDDATGISATRISDGISFTLGMWQKPPGKRGEEWIVNRDDVDRRVSEVFGALCSPIAFFADPSHARDDETQERFWDGLIDQWHRRYRSQLRVWAVPGKGGHSIMWDMTSRKRQEAFTAACERTATEITEHTFRCDGDPRLRIHMRNARRFPNEFGISIAKDHRSSPRKIDLAVTTVGSRMVRREVLNQEPEKKKRSGRVW